MMRRNYFRSDVLAKESAEYLALLANMSIPPLSNKSFLYLGDSAKFFCGFAFFEGANQIVGVENYKKNNYSAQNFFPNCQFEYKNFHEFAQEASSCCKRNVIIYNACNDKDTICIEEVINLLMSILERGGLLILMIDTTQHGDPCPNREGWQSLDTGGEKFLLPTIQTLHNMLSPYAWKNIYKNHLKNEVNRYIIHVRHPKPIAVLFMGDPGSGKSTITKKFFKDLPLVSGDQLWSDIISGHLQSPVLQELAKDGSRQRLDKLYRDMFNDEAWKEFIKLILTKSEEKDFVYEGYIPKNYRAIFASGIENFGYKVVKVNTGKPVIQYGSLKLYCNTESHKYARFLNNTIFSYYNENTCKKKLIKNFFKWIIKIINRI